MPRHAIAEAALLQAISIERVRENLTSNFMGRLRNIFRSCVIADTAALSHRSSPRACGFVHKPEAKLPWLLFALGQFLFITGDVLAYNYEKIFGSELPFPAISDVAYLLVYPCLIAGTVAMLHLRAPPSCSGRHEALLSICKWSDARCGPASRSLMCSIMQETCSATGCRPLDEDGHCTGASSLIVPPRTSYDARTAVP